MNRKILLTAATLVLAGQLSALAQVRNEGLANQIIAARQKNAALMLQYNWNSRTEFVDNGTVDDLRIDAVMYGPDGNLQRSILNDQKSSLPQGFFRRAIAENKRKQVEKYLKGLHDLLDQYTLSSAGMMINFVSQAAVQTGQAPDGTPTLTLTGGSVVNPGDTVTLTVNPTNFQTLRMDITTTYDGHQVTMSASFKTIKSGLTHLQFATVTVPDNNYTLQVQDYDYVPND
jgi:type II secretory pathway pseudopilin PulG